MKKIPKIYQILIFSLDIYCSHKTTAQYFTERKLLYYVYAQKFGINVNYCERKFTLVNNIPPHSQNTYLTAISILFLTNVRLFLKNLNLLENFMEKNKNLIKGNKIDVKLFWHEI